MQALLPLEVISPPSVGEEERPLNWMEKLEAARAEAAVCTRCALHCGRTHSVFSDGNPNAKLMLIGEGPGQNEDETGVPFVGKAGQLLNQILAAVKIDRANDIYICNVVKCRPPQTVRLYRTRCRLVDLIYKPRLI